MESYLFYSIGSLGICWAIFYFLLKNEKSFRFNRFYLLGSIMLCLLAPVMDFELQVTPEAFVVPEVTLPFQNSSQAQIPETGLPAQSLQQKEFVMNLLPQILLFTYLLVSLIFFFRFFRNLWKITGLIRKEDATFSDGLWVIPTGEKGNPFSFFNFVFINREDLENGNFSPAILKHEAAHSTQYHSVDILVLEFLSCLFWFNPFIWLYRKAILTNHEFLADEAVIGDGIDLEKYSWQLIQAGNKNRHFQLISGFNYVQTKKRLLMLHEEKSPRSVWVAKKFSVLLLLAGIFIFCSFSINNTSPAVQDPAPSEKATPLPDPVNMPFAVVEEAPIFPGCENSGSEEAIKECMRDKISAFVASNISPEAVFRYTQPEGYNVTVVFIIDQEGRITETRARATSPKLDAEDKATLEKEAIRVVNSLPQMRPGKHNGQVVGVNYAVRL